MQTAHILVDKDFPIAPLDRRVFGTFVEHMGRAVYGGIYEPGHHTADANGFRGDVLELTRELGPTIVRYPGGNFLSGYDWQDGVGPKTDRPVRLDLAWGSTETNQFGTDEFIDWCRAADVEPMFAVNTGTRGVDEARRLLEYCNHPGGTALANLRRANGHDAAHGIRFWCLGNEMDGSWQIAGKTAGEYGRIAQEIGKVMRMFDNTLLLSACGSSHRAMSSYAAWESEVLSHCYDEVDFISLHQYFRNDTDDISTYFRVLDSLDAFITEVAAIADAEGAKRRSSKTIMLSLDEWNVWYKAHSPSDLKKPGWPEAPPLLEEIYNFEDALIVGGALIVMMNHADRVKVACLAQLVNVIAPIFTETGGRAWRQTIFHPFALASRFGHGAVLRTRHIDGDSAWLLTTTVHDPATGNATVFALNRSANPISLTAELRGLGVRTLAAAHQLHHVDLKAINRADDPDQVVPVAHPDAYVDGTTLTATLKPLFVERIFHPWLTPPTTPLARGGRFACTARSLAISGWR